MRIPKYSEFRHVQIEFVDDVILQLRGHNGGMKGISLKVLTSQNCKQLLAVELKQNLDLVQSIVQCMVQSIVQSRVQSPAFTDTPRLMTMRV